MKYDIVVRFCFEGKLFVGFDVPQNERISSPDKHVKYHKQIAFPIIHCNAKVITFFNVIRLS